MEKYWHCGLKRENDVGLVRNSFFQSDLDMTVRPTFKGLAAEGFTK